MPTLMNLPPEVLTLCLANTADLKTIVSSRLWSSRFRVLFEAQQEPLLALLAELKGWTCWNSAGDASLVRAALLYHRYW